MGITFIEGQARGPEGQEELVNFLVDSGAAYSLLPPPIWRSLGLQAMREDRFVLADGTVVTRDVSFCFLALPQGEGYSPVVLGEPGDDQALLGAVTLENLGLVLNPFSRTLQPMRLLWRG